MAKDEKTKKKIREQIIKKIKKVIDPEIGLDIYTLGMIYDIKIDKENVLITMTLTTPFCPYAPNLIEQLKSEVGKIKGVKKVDVKITFDPPWQMSDDLKTRFGL